MILVGIGTEGDEAISDSVEVIRMASNAFTVELHDPVRLDLKPIAAAINAATERRIFFVSHGSQNALLDASLNRVPYLRVQDASVLRDCYVFAHACSTAVYLGQAMAAEALVYLGFDAPVSAPPNSHSLCFSDVADIYRKLAAFIQHVEYIDAASTETQVQGFLDHVKGDVLAIERKHDTNDGTRLDASEMICVRQFREDICAWIKGLDHMVKAAGAQPTPYLWS